MEIKVTRMPADWADSLSNEGIKNKVRDLKISTVLHAGRLELFLIGGQFLRLLARLWKALFP